MENLFKKITVLVAALTFTLSANAQDDKITGIYVDGVKVTEFDCYSFGDMEYIFPIDKLKGFDVISIGLDIYTNEKQTLVVQKETKYANLQLNSFQYNGMLYGRFKIFEKGQQWSSLEQGMYNSLKRSKFYAMSNSTDKQYCIAYCVPMSVKSYEEKYEEFCACVKKTPIYDYGEVIFKSKALMNPNTNGNKEPTAPKTFKERWYGPGELLVDLTLACPVKGTKLEDLLKSETKTAPANTAGGAATLGLKTVTEKHKNGKVKVQGQNNKDGNQEGTWKYFTEAGKLERVENYKNGISHGEWKYYDTTTGKVTKTEKYNEGELVE